MKAGQRTITICFMTMLLAAAETAAGQAPTQRGQGAAQQPAVSPSVWAAPPAPQAQPSSAFQSACGNQPLCYDTPDFAVAVVDFRMSLNRGAKVMDATLRFVNKTNQPLVLGYIDNSAVGLDDQGNRYGTYYNTGLAGMGIVAGNNIDPKFTLQPGGAGDARFELMWRPGAQDPIGSIFELGMTIREVNTLPGGQHTLGGEYPLRFQGLANGVTGASGASAVAGAATPGSGVAGASEVLANGQAAVPCAPSGSAAGTLTTVAGTTNSLGGQRTANATSTATNTAGNALAQFSSLKSMFGKKKAAASAPTANVGDTTPCLPVATGASTAVATGTSTTPAAQSSAVGATPTTTATPATAAGVTAAGKQPATASAVGGKAAVMTGRTSSGNTVRPAGAVAARPASTGVVKAATVTPIAKPATAKKSAAATAPAVKKPAAGTPPATPTK